MSISLADAQAILAAAARDVREWAGAIDYATNALRELPAYAPANVRSEREDILSNAYYRLRLAEAKQTEAQARVNGLASQS